MPSSKKRIVEIGEHSVYAPALVRGGNVLDAGVNHGVFSKEIAARFPVTSWGIEANPYLCQMLKRQGVHVLECALGMADTVAVFNLGTNDAASSLRAPASPGTHLTVRESIQVSVKTLRSALQQLNVPAFACVKLDIEGEEVNVIESVGRDARVLCPQWTVEFHDDPEFQLCEPDEVDRALQTMKAAGFSVLVRNWPSRTNVLFLDRQALRIRWFTWIGLKIRYQYAAVIWRKLVGLP